MVLLNVNGKDYEVDAPEGMQLLWVIREHLKLNGTKYGCGIGECGTCTVHIDGEAIRSCEVSVEEVKGKKITTIEGLPEDHPVKRAWIQEQVPQCGYCMPGQMMQAAALLSEDPNPTEEKVITAMSDVLCRCGAYPRIKKAIGTAVQTMREEGKRS